MAFIHNDRFTLTTSPRYFSSVFLFFVALWIVLYFGDNRSFAFARVQAETVTAESPTEPAVTPAQIEAQLKALETATDLDEAGVSEAKELLQQAKQALATAEKSKLQIQKYRNDAESATKDISEARKSLEIKNPPLEKITATSLGEAKASLAKTESELSESRDRLSSAAGEAARRQARLLVLPDLIAEAEKKLEEARLKLETLASSSDKPFLAETQQLRANAKIYALQGEIQTYQSERAYYVATNELLPLQYELLQRKVEQLQNKAQQTKQLVESKRESEIDKLLKKAKSTVDQSPPQLQPVAAENLLLVEEYVESSKRLAEITAKVERTKVMLEDIQADFKISRERVEAVGLNETLGLMFRRSKSTLANQRREFVPDGLLQEEIKTLQIEMFRLQDLFKRASETDASIERIMVQNNVPLFDRSQLSDAAAALLKQRRDILTPLLQTETELFNRLIALDTDRRKVIKEIDSFTEYVNEHVLWIRSGAVIGRGDVSSLQQSITWLIQPSNGQAFLEALVLGVRRKLAFFLGFSLIILLLIFSQRRLRLNIDHAGVAAASTGSRSFAPTATALISTIVIAALWPLVFLTIGWLTHNVSTNSFVQASSRSLIALAFAIYPLELLRQVCRNKGLGESHFEWAERSRRFIRANLRWLVPTLSVLLFFVNLLQFQPNEEFRSSLGRGIMVILLLVPFVYTFKVLHPNSQLYRGINASGRNDYWFKFRYVRFIFANLVLTALMLLTLGGYYYTTYQIGSRLMETMALAIGVLIMFGVSIRWLLVRRRRMKLEQMAAKREELQRQQIADGSSGDTVKVEITDVGLDANDVNKQAKELTIVAIGFVAFLIGWNIWADLFPAVGILDRVKLWSVSVSGVNEDVTLKNLLHFILAVTFTVLAVKNLPGILELLLLKRLPLDSGARYAVATILRYFLSVVGMIIAFGFLKIQWSQFSWLVAAISVGLGFGLQEIVANFVSGLILLLERPVRIGDIVTIEGTTGVVSKIQMRATTVTNWDQQELVVPNKNLITNSIFNWTLSNVLTRITLEVGVAYGTDPQRVQTLVKEIVNGHALVLQDPTPSVTFQTFGDSSLNFVVRCCIAGPDKRLGVIHDLQVAINNRFQQEGIEIPFPQRVIHATNDPAAPVNPADAVQPASPLDPVDQDA